jgi:hypothetical protein
LLLFFSDYSLPLSKLIIPNSNGGFKFEGQNIIFKGDVDFTIARSFILKERISNGILKVFVLC